MGQPAAKFGDRVTAIDQHLIQPPGPTSPILVPHPFSGQINQGLSPNVFIEGQAAATLDSGAANTPPHIPSGGSFVNPPANRASISQCSGSVYINNKQAARNADRATTCNDVGVPNGGQVVAVSTVFIG